MSINALRLSSIAFAGLLIAGGAALAADDAGPEPYSAADPHYAQPMQQEPLVKKMGADNAATLGNAADIKGPEAGPEPYSAPTPQYKAMTSEPLIQKTKTPAPKL